jgi:hypothetical protein
MGDFKLHIRMAHARFCMVAFGARRDRSIRTPTSRMSTSTLQRVHEAEEDRLVRIPSQQPIDQLPDRTDDLAW